MKSITKEDFENLQVGDILYSLNAEAHYKVGYFEQHPLHGRVPQMLSLPNGKLYDIITDKPERLARWAKKQDRWWQPFLKK